MIHIAICDDQDVFLSHHKQKIEQYLSSTAESFRISTFSDGTTFLQSLENIQFDIVFLDIDLPDVNGFEIAERFLCADKTSLVFVSSYEDLALESFEYHPYSFISKADFDKRIEHVLQRCVERFQRLHETITITYNRDLVKLRISEIAYIESARNGVLFHLLNDDEIYKTALTMGKAEQDLGVFGFVRIHSAFIVNLAATKKMAKEVTLDDGTILSISKKYAAAARAKYIDYIRRLP